ELLWPVPFGFDKVPPRRGSSRGLMDVFLTRPLPKGCCLMASKGSGPARHSRSANSMSPVAGVLLLGLAGAWLGCAQSSERGWWLASASPQANVDLAGDTIAGRVERIDAIARRATQMPLTEAVRHVRSLDRILAENSPTPVKVAAVRCLGQFEAMEAVD